MDNPLVPTALEVAGNVLMISMAAGVVLATLWWVVLTLRAHRSTTTQVIVERPLPGGSVNRSPSLSSTRS